MPNGLTNLIAQQTRRAAEALRRSQQRNAPEAPVINEDLGTVTLTARRELPSSLFTSNIGQYNYVIEDNSLGGIRSSHSLRELQENSDRAELQRYRQLLDETQRQVNKLEAKLQDKDNEIKDRDEQIEYLNYCIENDYALKLDKKDE